MEKWIVEMASVTALLWLVWALKLSLVSMMQLMIRLFYGLKSRCTSACIISAHSQKDLSMFALELYKNIWI